MGSSAGMGDAQTAGGRAERVRRASRVPAGCGSGPWFVANEGSGDAEGRHRQRRALQGNRRSRPSAVGRLQPSADGRARPLPCPVTSKCRRGFCRRRAGQQADGARGRRSSAHLSAAGLRPQEFCWEETGRNRGGPGHAWPDARIRVPPAAHRRCGVPSEIKAGFWRRRSPVDGGDTRAGAGAALAPRDQPLARRRSSASSRCSSFSAWRSSASASSCAIRAAPSWTFRSLTEFMRLSRRARAALAKVG